MLDVFVLSFCVCVRVCVCVCVCVKPPPDVLMCYFYPGAQVCYQND